MLDEVVELGGMTELEDEMDWGRWVQACLWGSLACFSSYQAYGTAQISFSPENVLWEVDLTHIRYKWRKVTRGASQLVYFRY